MNDSAVPPRPDAASGQPGVPMLVGHVEMDEPVNAIVAGPAFGDARLLVTVRGVAVGTVDVPLSSGNAPAAAVTDAVRAGLGRAADRADPPLPAVTAPVTVVVPTRGRPESLDRCLRSLLRTTHPRLTVLVVDNDPADDHAGRVVQDIGDPRVSYVHEPRRGTSAGRNRGLVEAAARGARFVAFVDDDVEVDPEWAGRVAAALDQPGVGCVCGPVLAAELATPAQLTSDEMLGWRTGFARRRFSLTEPPPESAIFPFSPGLFGVGANLAVDVTAALDVGGFDPALGPGTPTRAGEDCELMIRLVLAGHTLAHEPSAYVWHNHRRTSAELAGQLHGYDVGLGGFLTKIALDPVARAAALRLFPAGVRRLRHIRSHETAAGAPRPSGAKLAGIAAGAVAYLRARRRAVRSGMRPPAFVRPPARP